MKVMSLKIKLIALIIGIIVLLMAAVQTDMWFSAYRGDQAEPTPVEEPQP